MPFLLTISHQTSIRLAEVAFLLIIIAGVWFVAGEIPQLRISGARRIVAGLALIAAGVLLFIATHWGSFG